MHIIKDTLFTIIIFILLISSWSSLQSDTTSTEYLNCISIGRGYRKCYNTEITCYEKPTLFTTTISCKWNDNNKVRTIRYIREE